MVLDARQWGRGDEGNGHVTPAPSGTLTRPTGRSRRHMSETFTTLGAADEVVAALAGQGIPETFAV
jgi:hypothetical protein